MNRKLVIAALVALLTSTTISAQEKWHHRLGKWVQGEGWKMEDKLTTTHTKILLQAGERSVIDEYLSPTAHKGWEAKVSFLTDYSAPVEQKWHLYQEFALYGGIMKNPANSTQMYSLGAHYSIGPSWRVLRRNGFSLDLAPLLDLKVGGNIKLSNTNNIGNGKGSFGIDGWTRVRYQIPWKLMPLAFSYSAQLPLIQGAFHPEYGQNYYDYISGENGAKLGFYFGSLHNTQGIKQRLLVDLPINNLTLTLGAEHTYFQQKINYTQYREGSWGVTLGVSIDMKGFSGAKSLRSPQIHSTLYK